MSHQDTQSAEQRVNQKEAHFQQESSTLSDNENDHHKFIKLLNSLIFIKTDDSIWETWNIKIADKLNVNANHCYERIKTEQDWSFNQFAVNASEFSA